MEATTRPHLCAHAQCKNDATHVVVGLNPDKKIFNSGAGLCCDDHTREYSQMGGAPMPLDVYFETASDRA